MILKSRSLAPLGMAKALRMTTVSLWPNRRDRRRRPILVRIENRSAIQRLLTLRDPWRRLFALQIVRKPLENPTLVVDLVLLLRQAVPLARIHQQHDVLAGAARVIIEQ